MNNIIDLSANEISKLVQQNKISACEVALAFLDQIAKYDKFLRAWTFIQSDLSVAYAKSVDQKQRPQSSNLLQGVPVGIKDVFNTQDMPTCMGSPIWEGFNPGNDARVVHCLNMAGAVALGKTVTAEFAVHAPGPTRNPHHLDFAPGTSSSGSAAAVSARMVPIALGTQTAGSIIRPASYCGVYGMKPSFGLIPRTGTLKTTDTLDTVGYFSHSLEDLPTLFEVCRVKGEDFPISHRALSDSSRQKPKAGQPWQVGFIKGPKWEYAEKYAQEAIEGFAKQLGAIAEIEVTEINGPSALRSAHEIHSTIYDRTLAYYFREEFQKHTLVSKVMYEIVERGNRVTLEDYQHALLRQTELATEFDHFLNGRFDVILDLSTGGEALFGLESLDRLDNCLIWTLVGAPTVNLPVFKGPHGLPYGAQIVARKYEDYKLLGFAELLKERGLIGDSPMPAFTGISK